MIIIPQENPQYLVWRRFREGSRFDPGRDYFCSSTSVFSSERKEEIEFNMRPLFLTTWFYLFFFFFYVVLK
ncbi:uncharacterized protein BO80DRAFT_133374 [Aspergillus ibericus CBS 121593]|uniref:Uncharacterized protein n=1 Tax=Aspergillus ibericus CBS 121593 TaxID=1448316 RepID=A0A395HCC6_9EURO|nr:hypothetical protein BO80DRAFT_133374 [Aspergillus ibericus CBS 121593]RAL05286.1 hypothetical protein BO80DRAFT_133374 [Aspergillus ibericus CBS 121593]